MLPKKNRLNLSQDKDREGFINLLEVAEFRVKHRKSKQAKATAIVSKTVAKNAVDRNRIKRVILEKYRAQNLPGEFIFIAKQNTADKKNQNFNDLFEKITTKISS